MWLVLVMVMFGFIIFNGKILAAENGSCSCKAVFGNGSFKPVTSYEVKNNCKEGYEPEWGIDFGGSYGCNCNCKIKGTANSMPVNEEIKIDNNYSANSFCADGISVNTALGCIPVETNKFVTWLLGWLFGVAGGIAFLLMAYGFILVATSGGDEKKMAGAKETITSAVIGLLVCIFSIFILRLIMINILQIPGIN